jgi:LysM repeat protein
MALGRGKGLTESADANGVSALAASRFGLPVAVAPAKAARGPQRASVWSEPEPWIAAVLLATGVAVIARHPLARAIGTEVDQPTMTPSVVATAPPSTTSHSAPSVGAIVAPAPTHAPRDPVHALVAAGQALLAPSNVSVTVTTPDGKTSAITPSLPVAVSVPGSSTAKSPAGTAGASPAAAAGTCAGTVHTVRPGDTLWSIAAKAVKSTDTGRVNVAWHRLYSANHPPLGDNPSLVPVGSKICVPDTL